MTHPDPTRRRYAEARMHYPMLYEALLSELAQAGHLRSRARLASYERQLVDLTTGALVRAGDDFPISELSAELRANVDVFWMGAVAPQFQTQSLPAGAPAPQAPEARASPPRTPG